MRHIEIVSMFDAMKKFSIELVVSGEDKPRTEKCWLEPRVAKDRPGLTLDEDSGMTERRCAHGLGDGRVGRLLSRPRHVLGPFVSVPVAEFKSTRRVGVPACGHCR